MRDHLAPTARTDRTRPAPPNKTRPRVDGGGPSTPDQVAYLQRTAGNEAVTRQLDRQGPQRRGRGRTSALGSALLTLQQAQARRAADPAYAPTGADKTAVEAAVVEAGRRYTVDPDTYRVSFARRAGTKVRIDTIEDFILFVETVERAYPGASPRQVAGEIRQIWLSDGNWRALVDSPGITAGSAATDIETEAPIASLFDMTHLESRPRPPLGAKGKVVKPATEGGKRFATRHGTVSISHVLAGIDAQLNGSPTRVPAAGDEDRHRELRDANQGNPRDFATWSGDIGQAYAEYLVDRYVTGKTDAALKASVDKKAPRDQLLADIHGYIALHVRQRTALPVDPTRPAGSISDILRALYLVDRTGDPAEPSYRHQLEAASGKSRPELPAFIVDRSLAFARLWFAKKALDDRGALWGRAAFVLKGGMSEFDAVHAENERTAAAGDKLDTLVATFLAMLADRLR